MSTTAPLNGEDLLSLSQAARRFPGHRGADRLHPATLTRWIVRGVTAPDGRRVKLEAARLGHRWLTSAAALTRFAAVLTSTPPDPPPTPRTPSSTARRRTADRAGEALKAAGA